MSTNNTEFNFLQGGGDMGKLIRSRDWSKTPLGDPKTWPQPLRTMVSVMMDNPFGMYIAWGKEYTQIYNDGYRPILGDTKHPEALGISTKETFSEVWHIIGSMFDGVMNGEPVGFPDFMLPLNRNGYIETCYFDFAYSPIRLESGEVGGVLVTVIETTAKKKAEDELIDSNNELEFVIEAAQLGTFDFNPQTNKFSGNARLKQWFGLPPEEQIELTTAINVITEKDKERVTNAIQEVLDHNSNGIYDIEYTIINPVSQKEIIVHAKGRAWFNDDKIAYRLNGTVEDVTSKVLARDKIEEGERSLRLMILQAPVAIAIFRGLDYNIEIANKFALEIWGRTEEEVLNTPLFDAMPELLSQGIKEFMDDVANTGNRFATPEMPVQVVRNNILETVYINFSFEPLYDTAGKINGIMAIGVDVTPQVKARKKVEESEHRIRSLVESAPFPIALYTGEEMHISLANQSIIDIWGKGNDVVGKLYSDILPELQNQKIFEQVREVLHTGTPFHAKNQKVDIFINNELKSFYFNYNFTPVMDSSGTIYAVMNTAAEVTELNEAKHKVETALSEIKLFKFMADTAADPFILMEEDGSFVYLNKKALDQWGYTEQEMALLKVPDVDMVYHEKKYKEAFKRAQTGVIPPFETIHKNKQGHKYPVEINMGSVQVEDKTLLFAIARDITERKEAEQDVIDAFEKVEESEKRFRDSVKQAPLAISIFRGPDNITEMVNDHYLMLIEKTEKQYVGKPLFEVLPHVKETIAPIIADIYKTETAFYGYEFPVILSRQGKLETLYFNFVYHPLKENNEVTGIMVVATEVTATVKAKNLIEENEEKLKLIIEASELGVFDVNLKSSEIVASDRCYEILGFPKQRDLSHKDIIKNLHPDDLGRRKQAYDEAFEKGVLHYQIRVFWEDQSLHWLDAKGKVFYDENNVPERMVGTVRDITDERNFQQQLLEREEKFRLLADSMPQFIWTSDPDGNLNYFNQSVFDFSGLTHSEIIKQGWIQIVHPDDREQNIKEWIHSIITGKDFLLHHRFRKHNGEYRWQLSRAIPQKDADGVIKRWVGSSTDIQEEKMFTNKLENMVQQRTNELQQKNMDLERMNKELQSFVYISSHDLQEPLRKIQIFASRILETEYATLSENAQKHFTRMQKSANRMQNLIQDLIAYSRTNAQDIKFEIVDLHEIIEDTKETLSEELEQKDITFILNNICEVRIIPVQFQQVILNLVSNSIKFAKENHPVLIKIDCEIIEGNTTDIDALVDEKQYCHIRFSDNGIGFEQQYNNKIFEVFQRLHTKEEYTGTGIGLAIVKRIVENHDGIILAHSEIGEGATFNIYIPTK
ncbi:PAS domain S-box protein [Mariniflexile sp. AS56]|uniref:PAS domain-containing sensor histidine kinase n=1 Tax=Mariniflexile sp. AS56 TaxID=3063957 RepID=UPI0026F26A79|nr:PAS domain S-box protein [Mariniflexile sp. AS56]MDO7174011.1 PAS domain S-box protein [Mariniflexile sp. AS56]